MLLYVLSDNNKNQLFSIIEFFVNNFKIKLDEKIDFMKSAMTLIFFCRGKLGRGKSQLRAIICLCAFLVVDYWLPFNRTGLSLFW